MSPSPPDVSLHVLLVMLPCACCCRRWCGKLDAYSDVYDRVSVRAPATLGLHADRDFYYPRIMEDPGIQVRPTHCQRVTLCSDLFGRGALLVHSHVAQHGWDPRHVPTLTRRAQREYPMARTKGPLIRVTLQLYVGEGALHVFPLCGSLAVHLLWCRGTVHQELASDEAEDKATVFASDAVVAHLMAASRAVNPWYVRVRRRRSCCRSLTCLVLGRR